MIQFSDFITEIESVYTREAKCKIITKYLDLSVTEEEELFQNLTPEEIEKFKTIVDETNLYDFIDLGMNISFVPENYLLYLKDDEVKHVVEYHPNSTNIYCEYNLDHLGRKQGECKFYNGKDVSVLCYYKDNKLEGKLIEYSKNKPYSYTDYKDNKVNGEYLFYQRGKLKIRGQYLNGQRVGKWEVIEKGVSTITDYDI